MLIGLLRCFRPAGGDDGDAPLSGAGGGQLWLLSPGTHPGAHRNTGGGPPDDEVIFPINIWYSAG